MALPNFPKKRKVEEITEDEAALASKLFSNRILNKHDSDDDDDEEDSDIDDLSPTTEKPSAPKAVWHDEDDDESGQVIKIKKSKLTNHLRKATDEGDGISKEDFQKRLRGAFTKMVSRGKQPKWAQIREEKLEDDADNLVREITHTAGRYMESSSTLSREIIATRLLQDIAIGHTDSRPVNIVLFHRVKPVLIAAGDSGQVRLFKVDSEVKKEHFLQGITISRFPITGCGFLTGGSQILLGSRMNSYFMRYDMETNSLMQINLPREIPKQNCGHFCLSRDGSIVALVGFRGQVYILVSSSFDYIHKFSLPGEVVSLQFFPGSSDELWILTNSGQVFICNIASKKQQSFFNDGAVHGTSLVLSSDGQFLAIGENTGFINVYETSTIRSDPNAKPRFSLSNLLTSVGSMAFTHNSQVLAILSPLKKNQLRLVNVASEQTFQNFPAKTEQVEHALSVDFSPHGGYMAVGMKSGAIKMYRIEHFEKF